MLQKSKAFLLDHVEPKEYVDSGIQRQMLGFNGDIMMVKAVFEDGSIGYVHEHVHSQSTYVASGEFEVTIGDEVQRVSAGDSFFIEPNIRHGAVCIKAGVLIDAFSPCREDFLNRDNNNEN